LLSGTRRATPSSAGNGISGAHGYAHAGNGSPVTDVMVAIKRLVAAINVDLIFIRRFFN
jgi:hypothetical protein